MEQQVGPTTEPPRVAWYYCGNKRCRRYRKQFPGLPPAEHRQATGRSVSCSACGEVAWLRADQNQAGS